MFLYQLLVSVSATSSATAPTSSLPPSVQLVLPSPSPSYVTETVFGFLDFVTTVGNTVMVFTPANAGDFLDNILMEIYSRS